MTEDIEMVDSSWLEILDLGRDVLVMILYLILDKKDLMNLCLVLYDFCKYVLYRLYRCFSVNLRSREDVLRIGRSISHRTAYNLHHTRSMTIWDTPDKFGPAYPLYTSRKLMENPDGDNFAPDPLPSLQTLDIKIQQDFEPEHLAVFLKENLVKMGNLKIVTIINYLGASQVMSELGRVSVGSNSPLERLNVELDWEDEFNGRLADDFVTTGRLLGGERFDQCLEEILEYCTKLTSLHVSWSEPRFTLPIDLLDEDGQRVVISACQQLPRCILSKLPKMGHRLRSLSFHEYSLKYDELTFGDTSALSSMYNNCPNLEELGIQVSEALGDPHSEEWPQILAEQVRAESLPEILPDYVDVQIFSIVKDFVRQLVKENCCPELEYFVWGSDEYFDAKVDNYLRFTPQKYYHRPPVHKFDKTLDDSFVLPTMREILEHSHPEFDILLTDLTPYKSIKLPGRFYDDLIFGDRPVPTHANENLLKEELDFIVAAFLRDTVPQ
ncbi:hypothetical protein P171DRAFT_483167 [Karstenula rhodostoma CBS 690.94]|uniref:Uncharacterized protein n=1 Tax=Karstenula rhodostoma CBS 690.94 TaxID=1392251 RepID=A0A9P4PL58_9PLEO|nr:hypothetical protein P171DRAFT_483167 [Karstenula rhodostoma CBS 690.94]